MTNTYIKRAVCALLAALMIGGSALADVTNASNDGHIDEDATEIVSEEVQSEEEQSDSAETETTTEDTGYSVLFTNNPVPDIAERCLPSVVGVINLVSTYDFDTRKIGRAHV